MDASNLIELASLATPDPVAAAALGLQQGLVCFIHTGLKVHPVEKHPCSCTDGDLVQACADGGPGERTHGSHESSSQFLEIVLGLLTAASQLHHHQKFFATPATDQIAGTQLRLQDSGNANQHLISNLMPMDIIDRLEMINIQHDQTTAVTPHRLATIHKSTTIKCCRQWIENGIKLELTVVYRQAMHTTLQTQNRQH